MKNFFTSVCSAETSSAQFALGNSHSSPTLVNPSAKLNHFRCTRVQTSIGIRMFQLNNTFIQMFDKILLFSHFLAKANHNRANF